MDFVRSSPRSLSLKRCLNTVSGLCCTDANSKSLNVEAAVLQEKKWVKKCLRASCLGREVFTRQREQARVRCRTQAQLLHWEHEAALHSPLSLLLCRLPGELRWRKLNKKVPCSADQSLIRKVLWDLGQEVVHRGHVALAVQNFLLPVKHNLQRRESTEHSQGNRGSSLSLFDTSGPAEKNISLLSERSALPQGIHCTETQPIWEEKRTGQQSTSTARPSAQPHSTLQWLTLPPFQPTRTTAAK